MSIIYIIGFGHRINFTWLNWGIRTYEKEENIDE